MHAPHAPKALHLDEVHAPDAMLALATFAFGAVGLLLVGLELHTAGMWFGVAGVMSGLWGQLVSRTTSERFLDVIGMVAAALAFFLGAMYGGV